MSEWDVRKKTSIFGLNSCSERSLLATKPNQIIHFEASTAIGHYEFAFCFLTSDSFEVIQQRSCITWLSCQCSY